METKWPYTMILRQSLRNQPLATASSRRTCLLARSLGPGTAPPRPFKADAYLELMRTVALPDYRSTPGNLCAFTLVRREGDAVHFLMVTFWESEEAIAAFGEAD
jgi:hypothetical protein